MSEYLKFPRQQLPFSKKTKKWRREIVDWADQKTSFDSNLVRKSVLHKKINYDLLAGKLYMQDLQLVINPESIRSEYTPDSIQHYPIMNSKLNVLKGEESKRVFDFKVVVTNPNSISEIEHNKKEELFLRLQQLVANTAQSEEEFNQELEKINHYFQYEWQDMREIRANALLNHYNKEYNIPGIFNDGFWDAVTVGEEIYKCDIIGGEPTIERLNPLKVRILRSGFSNKIEDADVIVLEDYWSPGKIIDTFYDAANIKDIIKYVEDVTSKSEGAVTDEMDNIDERFGFVHASMVGEEFVDIDSIFSTEQSNSMLPYDTLGNIKVLQVYWKSRRKIKKVKSYDPQTGEPVYHLYPETYVLNEALGEEEQILYINEAWEGTKIGKDIYVNIRPRVVQYNRLSNPSRCHFGIVGNIYNMNDDKPFSMVDMMKPYNYLYDIIHDRLNKLLARNYGKIIRLDLAKVPKGWYVDKWLHYAKVSGIAVEDSFREGDIGPATGKLAGALNNASSGVIDAEFGNSIQQYINLLEFIKIEMSEVVGITRQREGQISNRETVGGVERATLQSSHITEWVFIKHEDVKKRVLECFLETAKQALKGHNKKFQYLLSDGSNAIMNIDGDEFAESDYGLVVDNGRGTQELAQKLDMLAQAALQNQTLSFSTIMKLYNSCSLIEKQRFVEMDEKALQEKSAQAQQQQLESQERMKQAEMEAKQAELNLKDQLNQRDNDTKLLIATMQTEANMASQMMNTEPDTEEYSQEAKEKLMEQIREFDARLALDKERLDFDKSKAKTDAELKRKQIAKSNKTSSK